MLPKNLCAALMCAASLCFVQADSFDEYGPPPPPPAPATPKLVCPQADFNWGAVLEGDVVEHAFEIRNEGGVPLFISDVKTTCGCTSSRFDRQIAPGSSGVVVIQLRTRGYSGSIKKTAQIVSNDQTVKMYTVSLSGAINPVVRFEPDRPALEGLRGETLATTVKIIRNVPEDIKIVSVKGMPASRIVHELVETKPGEEYELKLALPGGEKGVTATSYDRLTVLVQCGERNVETGLSLRIKLTETISAMPTYITFRAYELEAYQRNPASIKPMHEVILKSWQNKPFNVTALKLTARRFTATPAAQSQEIEPPIAATLEGNCAAGECKIRVEPIKFQDEESMGRPVRCELTITTDDPATSQIMIPVTVYFPMKSQPAVPLAPVVPPSRPPAQQPAGSPPVLFPRPSSTAAPQEPAAPRPISAPQAAPKAK